MIRNNIKQDYEEIIKSTDDIVEAFDTLCDTYELGELNELCASIAVDIPIYYCIQSYNQHQLILDLSTEKEYVRPSQFIECLGTYCLGFQSIGDNGFRVESGYWIDDVVDTITSNFPNAEPGMFEDSQVWPDYDDYDDIEDDNY